MRARARVRVWRRRGAGKRCRTMYEEAKPVLGGFSDIGGDLGGLGGGGGVQNEIFNLELIELKMKL